MHTVGHQLLQQLNLYVQQADSRRSSRWKNHCKNCRKCRDERNCHARCHRHALQVMKGRVSCAHHRSELAGLGALRGSLMMSEFTQHVSVALTW
jgi:hypothetical protein